MAKLKVTRCLGNPRPRGKKKAARKKRITRRAKPKNFGGAWVVRAIAPNGRVSETGAGFRYLFWGGSKWTASRNFAKRYPGAIPAPDLAKMKAKLPAGWVSLDVLPA